MNIAETVYFLPINLKRSIKGFKQRFKNIAGNQLVKAHFAFDSLDFHN